MDQTSDHLKQPVCLTIAGLDPSGGAGIIADIKTFSAFGCFAAAAVTSVTFQNTTGVFGSVHQTADSVRSQVEPVANDLNIAALKTGMLPTLEIIEAVRQLVDENGLVNIVVDPVVRSTSGYDLIDDPALRSLIEKLFPISSLITPNIPEAERITGIQIRNQDDIGRAAGAMRAMGAANVLIKGGHMPDSAAGDIRQAIDHLFTADGCEVFETDYIETSATHGTGCTLAAAITANLALGHSIAASTAIAKRFVTEAIRTAPGLGSGHSPINIRPY